MTAADLMNGVDRAAEIPSGFAEGRHVRHPKHGRGVILEVSGSVRRRTVTVLFDDDDLCKTFVIDKSALQPIGV